MIVHNLSAIYRNFQRPATGVGYIGLYLNVVVLARLNWIGVGPEREHLDVSGTGSRTRGGISGNNLKMVAIKLDRKWGRGSHATSRVIVMHF
jgi:hypothetical protein